MFSQLRLIMYTNKTRLHATFKNRKTVETWNTIPPERYFTLSRQSNTHMRTWWLSSPMKHFCGTFFINLCRFHAAEHKRVLFSRQTPARLITHNKKKTRINSLVDLNRFCFVFVINIVLSTTRHPKENEFGKDICFWFSLCNTPHVSVVTSMHQHYFEFCTPMVTQYPLGTYVICRRH